MHRFSTWALTQTGGQVPLHTNDVHGDIAATRLRYTPSQTMVPCLPSFLTSPSLNEPSDQALAHLVALAERLNTNAGCKVSPPLCSQR